MAFGGTIVMTTSTGLPPVPDTGRIRVYINSGGTLASIDENGVVTTYGTGVTQEQVEDYVGNLLQDSSTINVTYNDAGNVVTFDVIPGAVDHNALLNYVANQHVDHSTVSINAGTGLTGGGDITTSRTISMPSVGTPGTYKSVTTDAQGRVTAGTNPTTLAGYGITDAQPLDTDLTAIAALAGTGLVTRTASGTATTRTVTAGTGISVTNGDGVSGNPTVTLSNVGTAGTFGSATQIPSITTNAQGQVTSVTNNLVAIPSTQVTDFNEAAQDAVGGILTDSSSVDFTYSDGGNSIQAFVIPGGVDHNGLLNLTTGNPHTQYLQTSVAATTYQPLDSDLTAVAGLTGSGLVVRTGAGTATTRFIAVSTGLFGSAVDGVSGNPTIGIGNTGVSAATYGNNAQVPQIAVNPQGQITSATNVNISINAAQVQDFTEAAQDAMGGTLVDSSSIDFTYNDVANTQTAAVIPGGVNHDALLNFVANEHVDHSAVSITAGTGLSGGGDITTSRTLNIANTGVTAATYGSASLVPVITVNAQGQLTSVTTATVVGGEWQELINTATLTNASNTTLQDISDLAVTVVAGRTYRVEAFIRYRTPATATGFSLSVGLNGGATGGISFTATIPSSTTAVTTGHPTSTGTVITAGTTPAANTDFVAQLFGIFTCTGSGTLVPQFRSEVNGSTVTVQPGSNILAREWV